MRGVTIVTLAIVCGLCAIVAADEPDNKLYTTVNPGCNKTACTSSAKVNLVYTKRSSSKYDVHYLWSTMGPEEAPGFVVAQSAPGETLDVDWDELLQPSNETSKTVNLTADSSIGIVVTKLFIFNDTNNDGTVSPFANATDYLAWNELTLQDVRSSLPKQRSKLDLTSATFKYALVDSNFTISLTIFASVSDGQNNVVPRLLYTSTSFHVEIEVQGALNDSLTQQRVGLELALVHPKGEFNPQRIKTMDDEYSPGVFTRMVAKFDSKAQTSFMNWKPVGYMKSDRLVAHTVDANLHLNKSIKYDLPTDNSIVHGFYDNSDVDTTLFNITIGSSKDTFYTETNFTSFSFVVGLGNLPDEKLSTLVEMIILIGFGLPVVFILLGGVYVVVKRLRRRSRTPLLLESD